MQTLTQPEESARTSPTSASDAQANVWVERLRDGQIVVFRVRAATTRAVVDEWFDHVADVVKNWPAEKVYLAMQDVSDRRVALTPYARGRVREFDDLVKHLHGRIAIVLPNTFMGHLIRIFLTTMRWQKKLPTEGFLSFQDALNWLEKGLPVKDAPDADPVLDQSGTATRPPQS